MDDLDREYLEVTAEIERLENLKKKKAPAIPVQDLDREYENITREIEELENLKKSQNESFLQSSGRHLARGAKDVAAGAFGALDFVATPIRGAMNLGAHYLGYPEIQPLQETVSKGIDKATKGYTKPRNKSEEYASDIAQEVASLPFGYVGAGKLLAKAPHLLSKLPGNPMTKIPTKKVTGETLAQYVQDMYTPSLTNAAATAGSVGGSKYLTEKYLEDNQNPSMLKALGAGLVGGLAGGVGSSLIPGAVSHMIKNPAIRSAKDLREYAVGNLADWSPEYYEKHKGVMPASLGSSSKSNIPMGFENILSKLPWTSSRMRKHYQNKENAIKDTLGFEGVDLDQLPQHRHYDVAHEGAQKFHDQRSSEYQELKEIFHPLTKAAKKNKLTLDTTEPHKNIIREEFENLSVDDAISDKKKSFQGQVESKIRNYSTKNNSNIKDLPDEVSLKEFNDFVSKNLKDGKIDIPYQEYGELMTWLGNKINDQGTHTNEKRFGKKVYGLLKKQEDLFLLENAKKLGFGDKEIKALKLANKKWRRYNNDDVSGKKIQKDKNGDVEFKTKEELGEHPYVKDILDKKSDHAGFQTLLTQDPKYLHVVANGLGKEAHPKLLRSIVSHVGLDNGGFNFNKFHRWYSGQNLESQKLIKRLLPGDQARQGFENMMYLIGKDKKLLQSIANTSGTGPTMETISTMKKIGSAIGKIPRKPVEAAKEFLNIVGAIGGAKIYAKYATDPIVLERINKVMTSKNPTALQNHYEMLLKTPSVRQLLSSSAIRGVKESDEIQKKKRIITIHPMKRNLG